MVCKHCGFDIDTRKRQADGTVQCENCYAVYKPKPKANKQNTIGENIAYVAEGLSQGLDACSEVIDKYGQLHGDAVAARAQHYRTCKRCGSSELTFRTYKTAEQTIRGTLKRDHGVAWWLCIGWWLYACFFIFIIPYKMMHKRQNAKVSSTVATHKTVGMCKKCGYTWTVKQF